MDSDTGATKEKVRQELANYLGAEAEDIEDDSSLTQDLHMKASDLADFMEVLNRMDLDTTNIDLTEIETFQELTDALTAHE
jgi:acyl carrier protein